MSNKTNAPKVQDTPEGAPERPPDTEGLTDEQLSIWEQVRNFLVFTIVYGAGETAVNLWASLSAPGRHITGLIKKGRTLLDFQRVFLERLAAGDYAAGTDENGAMAYAILAGPVPHVGPADPGSQNPQPQPTYDRVRVKLLAENGYKYEGTRGCEPDELFIRKSTWDEKGNPWEGFDPELVRVLWLANFESQLFPRGLASVVDNRRSYLNDEGTPLDLSGWLARERLVRGGGRGPSTV